MNSKIKVMMATEGTYPFHHGGVSTWCDILVNNLKGNVDFFLYSIIMNPYVTQKFSLPVNTKLITVPLWGTEEPSEHLNIPFSKVYLLKKRTDDKAIKNDFLPLFIDLTREILNYEKNPKRFGKTLHELYQYFQKYEYKKSFKSELTWDLYKHHILNFSKDRENNLFVPGIFSIIQSLGWIYRFMTILNTPIPTVDVTHSAAAAFCGIPCVLAKLQNNTPYILTEHGVYLREQYLSLSMRGFSPFLKTFLMRLVHSIVNLSYYYADQISPVCEYNTRWEERFGVNRDRIKVIYNGADNNLFKPTLQMNKNKYPTVVAVARIDPVKDIITLLKAAAIVKKEIPDVRFVVYGSVSVPKYYEECLKVKEELGLGEHFIFAGHTANVPAAYASGDIVALSSVTEAFPYSVVEAMMSGKPVIATDVGGIREAMEGCGILVPPQNEIELSKGILKLLKDPELRVSLSEEGRDRALNYFSIDRVQDQYFKSYKKQSISVQQPFILETVEPKAASITKKRQKLLMEKGWALMELGYYREAIFQFRSMIEEDIESSAIPIILTKIAEAYNCLGEYDRAFYELEKLEAYLLLIETEKTA